MDKLVLYPTSTAQWHALINEAQLNCATQLDEELESYLVFLLMRYTQHADLASSVLATDFLECAHAVGNQQRELLRDVGDKCLLFSGLFPGRAERRHVRISYFVDLGQSAYATLADVPELDLGELFSALCDRFVSLVDVLLAMREVAGHGPALLPLQADELWRDTGSKHAFTTLCDSGYSLADCVVDEFMQPPFKPH